MPRATSAAWLALPPSLVTTPFAAWKPATSSASVNGRTSTTARSSAPAATASAAVNTIAPVRAPGDAALRRARRRGHATGEHAVLDAAVEGRLQKGLEARRVDRPQRGPLVEELL